MSQQSLQDLLGGLLASEGDRFEAAKEGRAPNSDWDGPPLPLNLEYRAKVTGSVLKPSASSGKNQFVITWEIQEPVEHSGRKLQSYYAEQPPNDIARRKMADLFGALQANMVGWGEDVDGFAAQFVGRTAVIAVDVWGEDSDRFGVRWVNADRGQTLKTDIKPKNSGSSKKTADLKADIVVPKIPDVAQTVTPPQAQQSALPGGGGPRLPPGLQ